MDCTTLAGPRARAGKNVNFPHARGPCIMTKAQDQRVKTFSMLRMQPHGLRYRPSLACLLFLPGGPGCAVDAHAIHPAGLDRAFPDDTALLCLGLARARTGSHLLRGSVVVRVGIGSRLDRQALQSADHAARFRGRSAAGDGRPLPAPGGRFSRAAEHHPCPGTGASRRVVGSGRTAAAIPGRRVADGPIGDNQPLPHHQSMAGVWPGTRSIAKLSSGIHSSLASHFGHWERRATFAGWLSFTTGAASEWESTCPPRRSADQCRLMLFAFCGRRAAVERLFAGSLAVLPESAQAFWLATADWAAGSGEAARRQLEALLSGAELSLRQAVERRLSQLSTPPPPPTGAARHIVAEAERETDHEEKFAAPADAVFPSCPGDTGPHGRS